MYNTKNFFEEIKKNKFFPKSWKPVFKKFKVVKKREFIESKKISQIRISYLVLKFIEWISFGKINMKYLIRTTTIGYTIYLGSDWSYRSDYSKWELVNHEIKHMEQWNKYWMFYPISYILNIWSLLALLISILFSANICIVIITFLVGLSLPSGLSMRAYWEWQAFKVSLDCLAKARVRCYLSKSQLMDRYVLLLTRYPYYFAAFFIKKQMEEIVVKYIFSKKGIKYK